MARPLRIQFEGAWYHVMNRGINKSQLFFTDKHRNIFLKLLNEIKKIYGIEVHAYCLMTNHYHLIIHTPRGNISHAMKYLNSNYARIVNESMHRDGPLFKGRFKAILISADDYLIRLSRYIHLNPLEANMVESLLSYKWSSYLSYLGIAKVPAWLTVSEIKSRFGEVNFHKEYRLFVEQTSDAEIEKFYSLQRHQPVLGENDFREVVNSYVKSHSLSSEIVGADRILIPPEIEKIVKRVAEHFNLDASQVYKKSNKKNFARLIAIYICRELGGYPLNEIGSYMGGVSYKAISSSICRVRQSSGCRVAANFLINELKNANIDQQ